MRLLRLALLPTLLMLATWTAAPVSAQTCNCGATGQWGISGGTQDGSLTGNYPASITGGPTTWQLTITGPHGILFQQTYSSAPTYRFVMVDRIVINYNSGGAYSVLYQLTDSTATMLRTISGNIVPFRVSPQRRFLVYYESGVWHLLRMSDLVDYYDYGDAGGTSSPDFGPQDRALWYENGTGLTYYNAELNAVVLSTTTPVGPQWSPCGDAFALFEMNAGAYTVEIHDIVDGGVIGSVTFPAGIAPTLFTDGSEHYGEYTDGGGVHDIHVANNLGAEPCTVPPPQPTSLTVTPSHGVGGGYFSVSVGLDKPAGFDGIIFPLNYDGAAYGPGSMGATWGQSTANTFIATSPVYGAPDTVHITVVGTLQSQHGTYVVDPVPPALSLIYYDSSVIDAGTTAGVWAGLDLPAPPGGATVALTSSNPALLAVPPTITVPQGNQYWSIDTTVAPLLYDQTVTVTGTYLGVQKQGTLTIRGPHPWFLKSADPCLVGGQRLHLAVGFNSAITPNGFDLAVTSSDTAHVHPATVHVARGQFTRYLDLVTSPVALPTGVTVSTSFNGDAVQFDLTLQPPQWFSTNLIPSIDPYSSYYYNSADAINDAGEVVGALSSGQYPPYLWNDGISIAPPNPNDWFNGEAFAISPSGLVVGQWGGHVFRWDGENAPVDLYPTGTGTAYAVNDAGHVAGVLDNTSHAFYYDGTMHDVGTFGGASSEAHGINSGDVVVGWAAAADGHTHAFRWTLGGGIQDLGMPSGATDAWAYAINATGVVVGRAGGPGGFHACQWDGGGAHYLDTAGGSAAYALNDADQVVGVSSNEPVMWSGGTIAYLDTLSGACAWDSYIVPSGINNHGQIVGTDQSESGNFAWILTLGAPVTTAVPPSPPAAEVPRALGLSVMGANPVRGPLVLRCALPASGSATLDVVDVTGRRVVSRELGMAGTVQVVQVDDGRALAPGMYFARLTQAGHARFTRIAVIR